MISKPKATKLDRSKILKEDWEVVFEKLMDQSLIDIPNGFYNEEIFFGEDESALDNIFTKLEEENLFNIHMIQEAQRGLEIEARNKVAVRESEGAKKDKLMADKKDL